MQNIKLRQTLVWDQSLKTELNSWTRVWNQSSVSDWA